VLSASAMAISMEALACGVKAGLEPDTMLAVINASSGRNTATTDKFPKAILPRTFDYGFNTELMYKDLKLLMQHADNLHVPMFLGRQVTSMWAFAMSQGEGPKDYTNLMKHIERWAGVEVRGKAAKG
jgi:3-hydroxyisobutyrate dehydrogenase